MVDINRVGTAGNEPRIMRSIQRQSANVAAAIASINKALVAVVRDYDALRQTVDVVIKTEDNGPTLKGIPILHPGGDLKYVSRMEASDPKSEFFGETPTVGILIVPDDDVSLALEDHLTALPPTKLKHALRKALFIPGIVPRASTPVMDYYNDTGGADEFAAGDSGLIHSSGSRIIFKENGDIIIKAAGNLYGGGADQDISSFNAAARQGDAGDGTGGGISGGSGRVFLGD